jgi:hypothetical protein
VSAAKTTYKETPTSYKVQAAAGPRPPFCDILRVVGLCKVENFSFDLWGERTYIPKCGGHGFSTIPLGIKWGKNQQKKSRREG